MAGTATNVWAVVGSGAIGAGAALIGQLLTTRASKQRQDEDLRQRRLELWSSVALPVATARVAAYEEMYDLLQQVIEERKMSQTDYARLRRLIVYVPDGLRGKLLGALTSLLHAGASGDSVAAAGAIGQLKEGQTALRSTLGVTVIESFIERLK